MRATRRATAAQRASFLGERGPEAPRARLEVMGYVEPLPDVRRICSLPGVARHVGLGVNAYLVRCLTLVAHGHAPGAVRWWQPPGDLRSAEVGRMGHVVSPCARVVETAVGGVPWPVARRLPRRTRVVDGSATRTRIGERFT